MGEGSDLIAKSMDGVVWVGGVLREGFSRDSMDSFLFFSFSFGFLVVGGTELF